MKEEGLCCSQIHAVLSYNIFMSNYRKLVGGTSHVCGYILFFNISWWCVSKGDFFNEFHTDRHTKIPSGDIILRVAGNISACLQHLQSFGEYCMVSTHTGEYWQG
jgi:hypothetical protein